MGRTIIQDAILYTGEDVHDRATLVLEGERVEEIRLAGPAGGLPGGAPAARPDDTVLDAGGLLVTPGLINAHSHIYSALARGMPLKDPPPENFMQNLERIWWRLDRALEIRDIELSAALFALEGLHAGVTTIFDHHASQRRIRGSLAAISKTLLQAGVRSCLCFEVSDRDGPAAARDGLQENLSYIREAAGRGDPRERALFGLHASFTLGRETLEACVRAGEEAGAGFHIHLAEDRADQEMTRQRDSAKVVDRLFRAGVLTPRTLCVHGVHLDQEEIELLARSGAWLVHCPESNMNNAVGAASLARLRAAGVRLALGTDGFTADMKREALVGALLQNHLMSDPRAGGATVSGLLFGSNAALAGQFFGCDLGRIRPGGPADLVVWGYAPPTPLSAENLWGHVLFGLVNAPARDVFVAGRPLLRAGEALTLNEDLVRGQCREAALALWERL